MGRVFALIALIVIGGRRISHLGFLSTDPIVLRFTGLRRLPTDRSLVRWLKRFSDRALLALETLIRDLVHEQIERSKLRRVTIDLDGTVLRTGAKVEGTARGFNPHHPKDCSYYPLTAHVAQLGQILRVWNRPGNVHDSTGAVESLRFLIDDIRERLGAVPIEVRLDGAFCQAPVLELLTASRVDFAMRMPMWQWLGVRQRISARKSWLRVNNQVSAFSLRLRIPAWKRTERVVVFRKQISGKPAKDFQLDLFQPDDGYYEYSMVVTNKTNSEATLWAFMAGRGGHEKTLAELKQHLAFSSIVTDDWDANSTWQLLSALTHNLVRDFQLRAGLAKPRRNGRKRTYRYTFRSMRTLRFLLIHLPGRIARPNGRQELRVAAAPATQARIQEIQQALAA